MALEAIQKITKHDISTLKYIPTYKAKQLIKAENDFFNANIALINEREALKKLASFIEDEKKSDFYNTVLKIIQDKKNFKSNVQLLYNNSSKPFADAYYYIEQKRTSYQEGLQRLSTNISEYFNKFLEKAKGITNTYQQAQEEIFDIRQYHEEVLQSLKEATEKSKETEKK